MLPACGRATTVLVATVACGLFAFFMVLTFNPPRPRNFPHAQLARQCTDGPTQQSEDTVCITMVHYSPNHTDVVFQVEGPLKDVAWMAIAPGGKTMKDKTDVYAAYFALKNNTKILIPFLSRRRLTGGYADPTRYRDEEQHAKLSVYASFGKTKVPMNMTKNKGNDTKGATMEVKEVDRFVFEFGRPLAGLPLKYPLDVMFAHGSTFENETGKQPPHYRLHRHNRAGHLTLDLKNKTQREEAIAAIQQLNDSVTFLPTPTSGASPSTLLAFQTPLVIALITATVM